MIPESVFDESFIERELLSSKGEGSTEFQIDQERYQKTRMMTMAKETSLDIIYVGQSVTVSEGDSLILPVQLAPTDEQLVDYPLQFPRCHMVQSSTEVEAMDVVPGLWDINDGEGLVTVTWRDVRDRTIVHGDKVGEVCPVQVQTKSVGG